MIRFYKAGDEKAIARLEKECFSEPWSENAVLESLENGVRFLVYEETDEICGYAGLQLVLDEGYVTNIAVTQNMRKKGIGKALVSALKVLAKENGLRFISLEVRESNIAAISLYEKQGFIRVGKRKNFYKNPPEDGIIMTLEGF